MYIFDFFTNHRHHKWKYHCGQLIGFMFTILYYIMIRAIVGDINIVDILIPPLT